MAVNISTEDRQAIYDNLRQYAWNLDRADGAGVGATLTPDGVIVTSGGNFTGPEGAKEFVARASSQEGFFGRQHHIQPLFIEETDGGYLVTSYWMVVTWHAGAPPFLVGLGYYQDTCVKTAEGWRFKQKVINRWDSTTTPPLGSQQR